MKANQITSVVDLKAIAKKVWFVYLVPILSWSFFLQSTLGFINSSIKI